MGALSGDYGIYIYAIDLAGVKILFVASTFTCLQYDACFSYYDLMQPNIHKQKLYNRPGLHFCISSCKATDCYCFFLCTLDVLCGITAKTN